MLVKMSRVLFILLLIFAVVLAGCAKSDSSGGSGNNTGSNAGSNNNAGNNPSAAAAGGGGGSSAANQGQANGEQPQYGGTLRIASLQSANTIGYPPRISSPRDIVVANTALETLARYDLEGNLVPHLALSWETDKEAQTLDITLRQGVKFHDGTDFNAEAAAWNLEQYFVENAYGFTKQDIESIEAIDEYVVRIHMADFNSTTITAVLATSFMVSMEAGKANGKDWMVENPVGTGPFKLVSWDRGVSVKYERNDNYWQEGLPYLDAIEWYFMDNSMTAEAALVAGEVDAIWYAPPEVASKLQGDFDVQALYTGNAQGAMLIYDSVNPNSPFADPTVRRAITHAIDRDSIVNSLLYGFAISTDQWSIPQSWSYNKNLNLSYDPEKAKELLAKAGYPNGFETTITFSNSQLNRDLNTIIQGYLANVGIKANLNPVDAAAWPETLRSNWDGILSTGYKAEVDATQMGEVLRRKDPGAIYTVNIIHPDILEEKYKEARKLVTIDEKRDITYELQRLVFDEYAILTTLYVNTVPSVKHKKVRGDGLSYFDANIWTPETAWISR